MKFTYFLIGAALLINLTTSCGGGAQNQSSEKLTGTIIIDGSSTVYPITEAVAEEFRISSPDVKVTIGVSGTGGGFKKFGRGETDINDASRPIKEKESVVCQENKIEYISLTVAYDGLSVVVNPQNDWIDHLTTEELKKLWEPQAEGVVMKWSDIRAGWPNENINLYGPDAASGTYDYFTEVIVGEAGKSRGDYTNSSDDNVLVQGVSNEKYALGFFGLAFFEENKDKLKLVGIDSGAGVVYPTSETVSSNEYTPLSRPIFIYVTKAAAQRPEVKSFVNFYINNASKLAKDVGFISLPAEAYDKDRAEFAEFSK